MKAESLWMLAALCAALLGGCLPYSTSSTEVGVRTVKWSLTGKKGVEEKIYPPGSTQFFVPFMTDWHTFDTRLQNLEMNANPMRGGRGSRDELRFKTIDGNDIGLDVIVSYRIDPEQAPKILQQVAPSNDDLRECIVRTITRSRPRDIFGQLNTEQFYIAEERTKKAQAVVQELNRILESYGVIVEQVGTRDYRFNPAYQQAIEDKKVADQEVERLKAETRAREEQNRTMVEQAKAEAQKITTEADGEYRRAVIEADAYYEKQTRTAEAILAEGRAEAEALRSMNLALSGMGGEGMVKMAVAQALKGKRIIMLPMGGGGIDLRTTDINALLELYGLKQLGARETAPKNSTVSQE